MWEYLVIGLSFLTGFLVVATINLVLADLFQRDQVQTRQHLRQDTLSQERSRARQSPLITRAETKDLQKFADEAASETAEESVSLLERLQQLSEQSGLRWSLQKILTLSGICAAGGAVVLWAATGGMLIVIPAGIPFGALPIVYLILKRKKRLTKLQGQLPDCFDLMARVIQSGQTIGQALHSVADEVEAPAGAEFGYCYEQQNLGLSPDVAYRELARRTGVLELKIFVLALLVHRQTGGNLSSLLENLSTIVRERFTMRNKIKSLTAEGRLQGAILLGLPPAIFAILLVSNREYIMKLFDHPSLMIITAGSMLLGAFWINRIINFDF